MVPLTSLVVPIIASAVVVFVASSIMHMVLPFHRHDIRKLAKEDPLLDTIRSLAIAPGDYGMPHPGSQAGMRDPQFIEKMKKGPVVFMTVAPGRAAGMGSNLATWFVFCLVVNLFGAYIASRALGPGAPIPDVVRFAGATAFAGYALGHIPASIWYRRRWATTLLNVVDGLIYGLLTGVTLGYLWPR